MAFNVLPRNGCQECHVRFIVGEPANGAADLPRNGRRIVQFCFAEEKTDLQKVYETRNGYQGCHVRFAVGKTS